MIDTFDSLEIRAFRMYDNSMKKIGGQEDLKRIKKAIQIGGQKLHTLKWGRKFEQICGGFVKFGRRLSALNFKI